MRYDQYIQSQIQKTRRQVKSVELATSLLILAAAVFGYVLAFTVVDSWLIPGGLPWRGRVAAFVALVTGVGCFVMLRIAPTLRRRVNPIYAALAIEQGQPSLKNSLINFLLLRGERATIPIPVYEAIERRAAEDLETVPVDTAVDRSPVIRAGYVLLALVTVICIYSFLSPKSPIRSVRRMLFPWSNVAVPTRVTISDVQPGTARVFVGESLTVSALVRGVRRDEPVTLLFTTRDGQSVDQPVELQLPADSYRHQAILPPAGGMQQSLDYRIVAGDATAGPYRVDVATAPAILIEKITYEFPAYTGLAPRTVEKQGDLKALEGTQVTVEAKTNIDIASAHIDFNCDGVNDLELTRDGRAVRGKFELRMTPERKPLHTTYQLRFADSDKQFNPEPIRYGIDVLPDQSPEIEITEPKTDNTELPINGGLAIAVQASDRDFGLRRVTLYFERNGQRLHAVELLQKPQRDAFAGSHVFEPGKLTATPVEAGDVLQYWAEARDNRAPTANHAQTVKYRLQIVSPLDEGAQKEQLAAAEKKAEAAAPPPPQPKPEDTAKTDDALEDPGVNNENMPLDDAAPEDVLPFADRPPQDVPLGEEETARPDPEGDAAVAMQKIVEHQLAKNDAENADGNRSDKERESQTTPNSDDANGEQPADQPQPGKPAAEQDQTNEQKQDQQSGQDDRQKSSDGGEDSSSSDEQKSGKQESGQGQGGEQKQGDKSSGQKSGKGQEAGDGEQSGEGQQGDDQQQGAGKQSGQKPGKGKPSPQGQESDPHSSNDASEGQPDGTGKQNAKPGSKSKPNAKPSGAKSDGADPNAANQKPGDKTADDQNAGEPSSDQAGTGKQPSKSDNKAGGKPGDKAKQRGDPQADSPAESASSDPMNGDANAPQNKGDKPAGKPGDKANSGKPPGKPGNKPQAGKQQGKQPGDGDKTAGSGTPDKKQPPQAGDPSAQPPEKTPSGGDPESSKGDSGAGQKDSTGNPSPSPQQGNQPRGEKKSESNQSGDQQKSEEAGSPSTSPKQSDSQGENQGDRSGGGGKGGGQKANQPGTGGPGQNTASDEGGGQSNEPGKGETAAGQGKQEATQPNGQPGGSQSGAGSTAGKSESPGEPPPGDGRKPGSDKPGAGQQKTGGAPQPKSGGSGKQGGQATNQPGNTGDGGAASPQDPGAAAGDIAQTSDEMNANNPTGKSVGGGKGDEPAGEQKPFEPSDTTADPADENFARRATDLALESLKSQMAKDEIDPELLDKLKWSPEDMKKFVDRWEQLQRDAAKQGAAGDKAREQLESALDRLGASRRGITIQSRDHRTDDVQKLRESRISKPPAEYREQFEAYTEGAAERSGK